IQETLRTRIEHRFSDAWRVRATYGWGRDRYDQFITRATAFNSRTGALTRSSDANLGRNDSDQIATLGLRARDELRDGVGRMADVGIRQQQVVGRQAERLHGRDPLRLRPHLARPTGRQRLRGQHRQPVGAVDR
ncbi:hypothetical protein M3640_22405, partial [Bacillus velezensis]|nr:hypothetical protein [Bacillus velezensis]